MNYADLILWGFIATCVQTIVMDGAQGIGLSRMSLPFILGTMFTANRDLAAVLGSLVHLVIGWLVAIVYALVFERLGEASAWLGMGLGLGYGVIILLAILPVLPGAHPRMASEHDGPDPTRALEPPGFLALNYGRWTPTITLIAHVAYGLVFGAFYQPIA